MQIIEHSVKGTKIICDECGEERDELVELGYEDNEYNNPHWCICKECLIKAMLLIKNPLLTTEEEPLTKEELAEMYDVEAEIIEKTANLSGSRRVVNALKRRYFELMDRKWLYGKKTDIKPIGIMGAIDKENGG
jgi:hypothetical protein